MVNVIFREGLNSEKALNIKFLLIVALIFVGFRIAHYIASRNPGSNWVTKWYGARKIPLGGCFVLAGASLLFSIGMISLTRNSRFSTFEEIFAALGFLGGLVFMMSLIVGFMTLFGKKV
jgi:hypothetical protein